MSDSIIERLRHHAQDERNTAFARSTMREAEGHIERLSNDLFDALDCKNGTGPTALSLVVDERDSLRAELAASREREARMRGALRNLLALDADHQRGADDEDVCAEVSEARAVLAEGAQG